MSKQRRQALDPAVAGLMAQAEEKRQARNGTVARHKVTFNLPDNLVNAIRREALDLTGHKRRGFSDLVTVLLQHGWNAYQVGDLKIEMKPATIETRITAAKK